MFDFISKSMKSKSMLICVVTKSTPLKSLRIVHYPFCCLISIKVWVGPPSRIPNKGVARSANKSAKVVLWGWDDFTRTSERCEQTPLHN